MTLTLWDVISIIVQQLSSINVLFVVTNFIWSKFRLSYIISICFFIQSRPVQSKVPHRMLSRNSLWNNYCQIFKLKQKCWITIDLTLLYPITCIGSYQSPISSSLYYQFENKMSLNDYKLSAELLGHSLDVRAVAAADKYIVSGSRDKTAKVWEFNG